MNTFDFVPKGERASTLYSTSFVAKLDGAKAKTEQVFYNELKQAFQLPDYFGENLDALYDCLNDLEWIENKEIILHIANYNSLLEDENTISRYEVLQLLNETAINWNTFANLEIKTFLIRIDHTQQAEDELYRLGLISIDK